MIKLEKLLDEKIRHFLSSGFCEEEFKKETLYLIPETWRKQFKTFDLFYYVYIPEYREGSGFIFFDESYNKIHTYYQVE